LNGDQRYIALETSTKENKRRKRRPSKKKEKPTRPLKDRVFHIMSTHKLLDYTHPSEVDPFWDKLYRQYEMLVYLEYYIKQAVSRYNRPLKDKEIADIQADLIMIQRMKELLMRYMVNSMYIQYGSVLKKKFYGWFRHTDRFIHHFNDEALRTIARLKFDPDRTRCSVYFYQVFWLSGIVVKNNITEELYSSTYDEEIGFESDYYNAPTLVNPMNKSFYEATRGEESSPLEIIARDDEDEKQEQRLRSLISSLLSQLGLGMAAISDTSAASIQAIAGHIKKAIKEGRIKLSKDQLQLLEELGINIPGHLQKALYR